MKLSAELKQVIVSRLKKASSNEILEIASQLCADEEPMEFKFTITTANQRFVVADGTVEDMATGLIWSQEDVGGRANWADAKKAAAALGLGGFKDWRLPTVKELLTLIDYDRHAPAIDVAFFPKCTGSWYWTSTPWASSPGDCAWSVYFGYGDSSCSSQGDRGLVRAVRSRQ